MQTRQLMRSIFEILNISPTSEFTDVKKAYHKMALKIHPDKYQGNSAEEKKRNEERFKELDSAFKAYQAQNNPTNSSDRDNETENGPTNSTDIDIEIDIVAPPSHYDPVTKIHHVSSGIRMFSEIKDAGDLGMVLADVQNAAQLLQNIGTRLPLIIKEYRDFVTVVAYVDTSDAFKVLLNALKQILPAIFATAESLGRISMMLDDTAYPQLVGALKAHWPLL